MLPTFKRTLPVALILLIPLFLWSFSAKNRATASSAIILGIPDPTADRVLGQNSLTTNTQPASPSATVLRGPAGVAIRPGGRLFVVDYYHNRVLSWPNAASFSNGAAADLVLGQSNLNSMVGTTTQAGLNAPESVAIDGDGNVWIADSYNHRLLRYTFPFSNGMNADLVLGQADFTSNQANRGLYNPTGATLWFPRGIDFDSQGKLYVGDQFNNRVLIFTPPFTNGESATSVIGQADYASGKPNQDGLGAKQNGFYAPVAVLLDSADNLYVADRDNNRVLRFDAPLSSAMDASMVIGQPNFTTASAKINDCNDNPFGGTLIVDANHLSEPLDLALDNVGDLIVSDICNHRVLTYQDPGSGDVTADFVYGQADFSSGTANRGGTAAANTLNNPLGLVVGTSGSLYVADFNNNRLLAFDLPAPFTCDNVAQIPNSECGALVTLYDSLSGSNWLTKTNWMSNTTPCSWYGVICKTGHVTTLNLANNHLVGTLPTALTDLPQLEELNLEFNQIIGGIPKELGSLSQMAILNLSNNQLGGTIPAELGNLQKLVELYLLNDQLSGQIPTTLWSLPQLGALSLAGNQLTGSLGSELGNLPAIEFLALCNNKLSGGLPAALVNLTKLINLCLSDNQFSGALPANLGNLVNLQLLSLSANSFSGSLPSTLVSLSKLNEFYFDGTELCVPQDTPFLNWLATVQNLASSNLTCTASSTPTHTPTSTPTATATATSITPTKTPVPAGDAFENDDDCTNAKAINTTGTEQAHTFHVQGDADWLNFDATNGIEYRIEVTIPDGSAADVDLEVYTACEGALADKWKAAFNPGVRLNFTATENGTIHLKLANHDPAQFGSTMRYTVNVRQLSNAPTNRALIIVAGRLRGSDRLQKNIHNLSNQAYKIFQQNGYDNETIKYLATDSSLAGWDEAATKASVQAAITSWAVSKTGANGVITLYMVDHGHPNLFYVDEVSQQRITPSELNDWLTQLENAVPGVTINVIIEACQSGSFIQKPNSISKAGRLVITSTDAENDAKASTNGAYFSDQLLTQLAQGRDLANSFSAARKAAKQIFSLQDAWLDADGDGVANQTTDNNVAAQRSFAFADTLGAEDKWSPYIFSVQPPPPVISFSTVITVDVRDNLGVRQVWAVVYPPDYTPPAPGQELQPETLENFILSPTGNADQYAGKYSGFTQIGTYRLMIYADDADGLAAAPVEITVNTGSKLFLPLVTR